MTAPNRVDDLRKRYHENPKRFFAPLANEYRKTGFVDRAILLCEKHLAEQPENMNGLVVYGQCLFESGRTADAHAPFEAALGLDPENLIALRHLGDIARIGGDNEAAQRWYERVLELDRRNEEVLELIEQVGGRANAEPSSGPSAARNIVSVARSVSVSPPPADFFGMGNIEIGAPEGGEASAPDEASEHAPLVLDSTFVDLAPPATPTPASSAVTSVRGAVARPLPPDSTAPTVEIPDPSRGERPKRRASILDIAFDFGEGNAELGDVPTRRQEPAAPVVEIPSVEIPSVEIPSVEVPSVEVPSVDVPSVEIPMLEMPSAAAPDVGRVEGPPARTATPVRPATPTAPPVPGRVEGVLADHIKEAADEVEAGELLEFSSGPSAIEGPLDSLIEQPLERPSLRGLTPVEGLHQVDFGADIEPLPDLDPTEFTGGDAALMGGFAPLGETLGSAPMLGRSDTDPFAESETEAEAESAPLTDTPRTFVTETMAQLYVKQGFRDRAIAVYQQLIEENPGDVGLRSRLAALEDSERPSFGFEPTVDAEEDAEAPPPNAMLADVSFEDVALDTPPAATRTSRPTPPRSARPTPAPSAGPTAREFLRAFAHRALTPVASPPIAPPTSRPATPASSPSVSDFVEPTTRIPGGGLDRLFGSEVNSEDERAAHRLAAVATTSGPSGGSAMDSLFGEGPSAPPPPGAAAARRHAARVRPHPVRPVLHADRSRSARGCGSGAPR